MTTPPLPEQIELHRDRMWRRDEDLRIESAADAERFISEGQRPGRGPRAGSPRGVGAVSAASARHPWIKFCY